MGTGTGIVIAIFIIGWIGKEIYAYGRQNKFNSNVSEAIKMMSTRIDSVVVDMKSHRSWGEKKIAERADYNERRYLSVERFNECNKITQEKLDRIEKIDLPSRMVKIEVLLENSQKSIDKLDNKFEQILAQGRKNG